MKIQTDTITVHAVIEVACATGVLESDVHCALADVLPGTVLLASNDPGREQIATIESVA